MQEIINNIYNNNNLEFSYKELSSKLLEHGRKQEALFTLESLCRIFQNNEVEQNKVLDRVRKLHSVRFKTSYEKYNCLKGDLEHELPINIADNDNYELALLLDRFVALRNTQFIEKNEEIFSKLATLDSELKILLEKNTDMEFIDSIYKILNFLEKNPI